MSIISNLIPNIKRMKYKFMTYKIPFQFRGLEIQIGSYDDSVDLLIFFNEKGVNNIDASTIVMTKVSLSEYTEENTNYWGFKNNGFQRLFDDIIKQATDRFKEKGIVI